MNTPRHTDTLTTETETKHTPGPWHVIDVDFLDEIRIETDEDNPWLICKMEPACNALQLDDDEEDQANARLIAAAPELLEALQGVLRIADRKTVEFDAARAAIAKAKGGRS